MYQKSLAIVGTGIAGMAAGYFLKDKFDITFYEKNSEPGGHTHTVEVWEEDRPIYIDTGFMVYNEVNYPHLTRFFEELAIETEPTSMSFSVQHLSSGLEYCGSGISGIFADRKNIFNFSFIRLLFEISRFNKIALEAIFSDPFSKLSLREYAKLKNFSSAFLEYYLLPMSSAIWSTPPGKMLDFPVSSLVCFFKNHGLLGLDTHFQWRTVKGGSRRYRDKVMGMFSNKVRLSRAVTKIKRDDKKVIIQDDQGEENRFDLAVVACHADEAVKILDRPTTLESRLLGSFQYQRNDIQLHTDERVMPRNRRAWSSWNARIEKIDADMLPSLVYDMNRLQRVSKKKNYFISVNGKASVRPDLILWEKSVTHPMFDRAAIDAQQELQQLNIQGPLYFCGSYFKYGFHEDAFDAALAVVKSLTGSDPYA